MYTCSIANENEQKGGKCTNHFIQRIATKQDLLKNRLYSSICIAKDERQMKNSRPPRYQKGSRKK